MVVQTAICRCRTRANCFQFNPGTRRENHNPRCSLSSSGSNRNSKRRPVSSTGTAFPTTSTTTRIDRQSLRVATLPARVCALRGFDLHADWSHDYGQRAKRNPPAISRSRMCLSDSSGAGYRRRQWWQHAGGLRTSWKGPGLVVIFPERPTPSRDQQLEQKAAQ